jgi:alpha-glucosidase
MKRTTGLLTSLISSGLFIILESAMAAPSKMDFVSPDGSVHCFITTEKNQIFLSLTLNGKLVIENSPLLMSIDDKSITTGVKTGKIKKFNADETYPWYGLHSIAVDRYNGASISFTQIKTGIKYTLEVKTFNDAVAFRFIVPGDENSLRKPDESTVFRLPSGSTVWYHDLYMHYEGVHTKKVIDTIPSGQWAAPPLTFKLPGGTGYAAITEANVVNYAGMALQTDGKNGFTLRLGHSHPASYPYVLRYSKEDVESCLK